MARPSKSRGRAPAARPQTARPRPKSETPWLEWAAAGLGLALILAVFWVIGREALSGPPGPPVITVRAAQVTETRSGYVVDVVATNSGGKTAAQVVIEGELAGGREPEAREATIDYLPAGSERRAGLVFNGDPRTSGLKLRAKGFIEP